MRRIGYLDGLRGLAAMQVVLGHCMLAFAPARFWGPFRLLWDGDFAVFLFFLISGFVLTFSFERDPLNVAVLTLRRIIRLGFPLAAAAFLCFLAAASFPELHLDAARLSGSHWLARMMPADPVHALADMIGAGMLIGYQNTGLFQHLISLPWRGEAVPDAPQWSLHIEFWGSLLLIGLVYCRYVSRFLYATALVATAIAVGGNALILFLIGNLIAHAVRARRVAVVLATKPARVIAGAILVTGLMLDYNLMLEHRDEIPLLWRLDHLHVSGPLVASYSFFHFGKEIAAILTFGAIFALPSIQAYLRTRILAWLGAMSFSVYLLHWGIVLTLGSWVYAEVLPQGRGLAVIAAIGSVIVAALACATGFERWVDRPAIRLSHKVGRRAAQVAPVEKTGIEPPPIEPLVG